MSGSMEEWRPYARCRGRKDPEYFFVPWNEQQVAAEYCGPCVVRYECLAAALDKRTEHGVWGGMTEAQRRECLVRYPNVASWARALGPVALRYRAELAAMNAGGEVLLGGERLPADFPLPTERGELLQGYIL